MSLPGDLTTFTLTFGPYTDAQGTPVLAGKTGTLRPDRKLVHTATGQQILETPIRVSIDEFGTGTITNLPHTDNAGLDGGPFSYKMVWDLTSSSPSPGNKQFQVLESDGDTIDFDLLEPSESVPAISVPSALSVAGLTGAVSAPDLVTALDDALADDVTAGTSTFAVAQRAAFVAPLATTQTVYVTPGGDDGDDGLSWKKAKATIPAAITALGAAGGTVELGPGTHAVASTGRRDTCTFTAGSSTVADTSIGSGDVGARVISPYLRSPVVIATVTPGVSFTITDETGAAVTPETSGSAVSLITKPAVVVPPGVRLRGAGSEWTADTNAQTGLLNHANTWIEDSGTGVTVLCGHPRDAGASNSGQQVSGVWLEGFAIKGNSGNLFGLAQINNWFVVAKNVDCVGHGMGGLLVANNANSTRFVDCRFGANGAAAATVVTGGVVVLDHVPVIPYGPVRFDNCFFTGNYGWNIVGTANFTSGKGARSVRVTQGQFNNVRNSTLTGSGTHAAISGNENRSLLDDCIFESADTLHLDVYDAPVTIIACKFKATGGTLGTLDHSVRVNAGAILDATGCGFLDATSYAVQVASGGTFTWRSCTSTSAPLAADASGNTLAIASSAGLSLGSTATPVEGATGQAANLRGNETCSRLQVNSSAIAVVSQSLNLTYFTATKSATVSQVAVEVGGTPASGGLAAYIGIGLYLQNADGSLTLVASTSGSNQSAFQSADAAVTLNLSSSVFVTAGRRYAIGLLVNSSNTLPTFRGIDSKSLSLAASPVLALRVTGQTSLPASIASGSLTNGAVFIYSRLP